MFLHKQRFNISQDWEVLGDDFDSVSSETISDAILQALSFHYFSLGYLKKRVPQFVDITNKLELAIEPKDDSQPIMDSEDEIARKEWERTAKRKTRHDNLSTPM